MPRKNRGGIQNRPRRQVLLGELYACWGGTEQENALFLRVDSTFVVAGLAVGLDLFAGPVTKGSARELFIPATACDCKSSGWLWRAWRLRPAAAWKWHCTHEILLSIGIIAPLLLILTMKDIAGLGQASNRNHDGDVGCNGEQ